MAILRRGARTINVDGTDFRWNMRRKPTYSQGLGWSKLSVAVEQSGCRGCVLVGHLPQFHSGNWVGEAVSPVLPSQVAHLIRAAVAAGWNPEKAGKPFRFRGAASSIDKMPRNAVA